MIFATCPICNFKIEDDNFIPNEEGSSFGHYRDEGECPNCKTHYNIDADYPEHPESSVETAFFDYDLMNDEEKKIEKEKRLTIIKKP